MSNEESHPSPLHSRWVLYYQTIRTTETSATTPLLPEAEVCLLMHFQPVFCNENQMQQWIKWSEEVSAPIRNRFLVHWFSVSVTAWSSRQVTTAWKFEIYTKKVRVTMTLQLVTYNYFLRIRTSNTTNYLPLLTYWWQCPNSAISWDNLNGSWDPKSYPISGNEQAAITFIILRLQVFGFGKFTITSPSCRNQATCNCVIWFCICGYSATH